MALYKTLLVALTLAFIALKANAQILPLFNLEPERVSPQTAIDLPKIPTIPGAIDFFFEPDASEHFKTGQLYPVVHMRIPKAPYFETASSNGPYRVYEKYIHMFYPDFSGFGDQKNSKCFRRVKEGRYGWCRREMIVGFGFSLMLPKTTQYNEYKRFQEDITTGFIKRATKTSRYKDLFLAGIRNAGPNTETFYVGKDMTGRQAYVFRCYEYVPSPICETRFRAAKSPYIFITLTFVWDLLPQWQQIIASTRRKVDSMIVKTYFLKM